MAALTVEFTGAPILSATTRFVVLLVCRETGERLVYDRTGVEGSVWYQADLDLPEDCS